jgi:hypothetical protein
MVNVIVGPKNNSKCRKVRYVGDTVTSFLSNFIPVREKAAK